MNNFIVLVAEDVINKSRGPKDFKRFKPFDYTNAKTRHEIVYAKGINENPEEFFHQIEGEMAIIKSKNTDIYNVVKYTISVLDIMNNKVIYGEDVVCGCRLDNKLLLEWGIIDVNEMTKSQKLIFLSRFGNASEIRVAKQTIRELI